MRYPSRPRDDIAVIDTNIITILASRSRSPHLEYYRAQLAGKNLVLSFITVHEVLWGMSINDLGPERRAEILTELGRYEITFPTNELISASVHLRLMLRDQPLSFHDLFVASSALALRCPLVTDDRKLAEALSSAGFADVISRHLPEQA